MNLLIAFSKMTVDSTVIFGFFIVALPQFYKRAEQSNNVFRHFLQLHGHLKQIAYK